MSEENTTDLAHEDADAHHDHGGIVKYLVVFLILFGLTALSFGIANSKIMNTPSIGWAAMMAVSCGKAMLVILFFMHLLWEANWKYVLTIPASIMSVFMVLMLVPDIGLRTNRYSEERWQHAPEPLQVEDTHHEGAHDDDPHHPHNQPEAEPHDSDAGH